jgi:hypothetical protein
MAIRAISKPFWLRTFCKDDENAILREVDVGPLFVHYRQILYARRGYCSVVILLDPVSVDCFPSIAVLTLGYP